MLSQQGKVDLSAGLSQIFDHRGVVSCASRAQDPPYRLWKVRCDVFDGFWENPDGFDVLPDSH